MKKYENIDGLRTIACIGILLMHLMANIQYNVNLGYGNNIIKEFTNFVFLFMIISSFSMCCGYYEKIKNNKISPEKFYSKRIKKTLPFFMFLLIINIIVEPKLSTIIESFTNSTLMFNFLQKDIEVLGVAWFIGLVFAFYFIFPFFVYLFSNKRRAIFATIIAFIMNLISIEYFNIGRSNMFYSFVYFCVGGLIYLYKDKIINLLKKSRFIDLLLLLILTILYLKLPPNGCLFTIKNIILFTFVLCYSISVESKTLNNNFTKYIGKISLEIYLSHMVIFRIIEKMKLTHVFSNNICSYFMLSILVLIGTIILSKIFNYSLEIIKKKVIRNENIISK